ncbi:MAG: FHA domain-containing protein [Methanobacteriota archaeon]
MSKEELKVDSVPRLDIDFESLAKDLHPLGNPKRLHLLHYLTQPHYLEEVASELKMARQSAQKHIDQLLEVGVIRKQHGERASGPVTEYLLDQRRLFTINEEFGKLGTLQPKGGAASMEMLSRTQLSPAMPPREPPTEDATPRLVIVHGMKIGTVVKLKPGKGSWLVGRDTSADVPVDYDPFISNRHAEIRAEQGKFKLVDAFSTNGTFLNWRRVDRGAATDLRHGDVVGVGKTLLLFRERA